MFNEKQKREYINFEEVNPMTLELYFKRISNIEHTYNKDIADMNTEELKTALISLNLRSTASRSHIISLLRPYMDWCVFTGKTNNENKLLNIKPDDIGSVYAIRTQMLRSPEQVRYILNTIYNPDYYSQPNRATQNKLIFWLLYCGLKMNELPFLKKMDIDYNKKVVKNPINRDISYDINDDAIYLWERYVKTTYIEKGGVYHEKDIYYCELIDNDFLLRPTKGNNFNIERTYTLSSLSYTVVNIFKEYFKQTSELLKISPNNINLSGAFYRVYLEEKKGEQVTSEMMSHFLHLAPSNIGNLQIVMRKYIIDYNDWKQAFNL